MFADVILPFPLSQTYTYVIPQQYEDCINVGFRVIVPFGKSKYYTAIVVKVYHQVFLDTELKEIHSIIDNYPIVEDTQLSLWEWISFYYMCPLGDVYKAAVPSKLRLESETYVQLSETFPETLTLTESENKVITYLQNNISEKITSLEKNLTIKNLLPVIYSLQSKGIVEISEEVSNKYAPKKEIFIELVSENQEEVLDKIGKSKKQAALYTDILNIKADKALSKKEVIKLPSYSAEVYSGLTKKNIIKEVFVELQNENNSQKQPNTLNNHQQTALTDIENIFNKKQTCLLFGVTSSGKTEVYIHLIEKIINQKKQVLFLVPEIALTTQLTLRLRSVFGKKLGIYHSKIKDNERTALWLKMLSNEPYEIIIGVRSSLFLPFKNLGLVIVDEEHESSYKQQEPSPRYHGRDTALMLAHIHNAKTLLGSATPSIESFFNAHIGKYGIVEITQRFDDILMPEISVENTAELRRKKKMKTLFSPNLQDAISASLQNGEQSILFRNRRGYAPIVECKDCGWTPKCKKCDVSLTFHKYRKELVCHYCDATYRLPKQCPECGSENFGMLGLGTEQLEEETAKLFPDAKIARMDTDTMKKQNAYEKIIEDFQEKKIDILVGTQMLSKGLDFDDVGVVGIISADTMLNYPDFRAHERAFQLMVQAAGRAGRKNKQGNVFIQTNDDTLPIYSMVKNHNYKQFFELQLSERKLFHYPPFYRLIKIVIKDRNEDKVNKASQILTNLLKKTLNEKVLGPNIPVVSRIKLNYIRNILIKTETGYSIEELRNILKNAEARLRETSEYKYLTIYYDVDPL